VSTQDSQRNDEAKRKLKQKLLDFAAGFPFFNHMGLEVEDMSPGYARVSVELVDHLRNPSGQMHSGEIATLVDMSITQAMLMTVTYQSVRDTRGIIAVITDWLMNSTRPPIARVADELTDLWLKTLPANE